MAINSYRLLWFRGFDKPLRILAAGGGKIIKVNDQSIWQSSIGKPVDIKNSVCGYYLTEVFPNQIKKGPWVTNPKIEHLKLFKSFQGTVVPESEMVVPLQSDGEIIGVLNFEHERPNVFSRYHMGKADAIASVVTPFLNQTRQFENRIKRRESDLLKTVAKQIQRIKKLAQHRTKGYLSAIKMDIDRLKRRYKEDKNTHKVLDRIHSVGVDHDNNISSYIQEIPDYLRSGEIDLKLNLRNAIKYFKPKSETVSNEIDHYSIEKNRNASSDVEVHWPTNCDKVSVFASQMLQDHFFNFLNNSLESIGERRSKMDDSLSGLIVIKVSLKPIKDDLGKTIPGQRIAITVLDNGIGIEVDELPNLFEGYTAKWKKDGWGFGLRAAREYIRGFGGDIDGDNRGDETGFELVLYLDEYDPIRHTEYDFIAF